MKIDAFIGLLALISLVIPVPLVRVILSLFFLTFILMKQKRVLIAIYLMLFFPQVVGYISIVSSLQLSGMYFFLIGFVILIFNYKLTKIDVNSLLKLSTPYLLIILVFIYAFLFGPKTEYAKEKVSAIIVLGSIKFIVIYILLSQPLDWSKLAMCIILGIVVYVNFITAVDLKINLPFSYGSLRNFDGSYVIHMIGIVPLIGISFILSKPYKFYNRLEKWRNGIYILLAIFLIYVSGTRQALFGLVLLFLVVNFTVKRSRNIVFPIIIILSFWFVLELIAASGNELINKVLNSSSLEEGLNRSREITHAFDIMANKLLFGVGLGGFVIGYDEYIISSNEITRWYPHNLILELIAELGLIGFIFLIIVLSTNIQFGHIVSFKSKFNFYVFPVFFIYLLRAMVSGDILESHVVFSFLFAFEAYRKKSQLGKYRFY